MEALNGSAYRTAERRGLILLIALIAMVAVAKVIQADTMDPDAFWHLRVADQLHADGIGPLVDRISFASEKTPWAPYSWLAELAMRAIWAAGGFQLAQLITAACSAAIVALIALAAALAVGEERRSKNLTVDASSVQQQMVLSATADRNPLAVSIAVAVGAFFTLPFISFRPVSFALVIIAAVAWLMRRDMRRASKWTWLCLPLALLATNLHLYSVFIAVMAILFAAGTWSDDRLRFRRRLVLATGCCVAVCGTPMLPGAMTTALHYNTVDPMVASNYITEMRPFYSGASGKVSLVLALVILLICLKNRRRLPVVDKLWIALGVVALVRLGRFSPVFAILVTPAFAASLPKIGGRALTRTSIQMAMAAVIAFGALNIALALPRGQTFDDWLNRNEPSYPTEAAKFVDVEVPCRTGKLINEFNWGGYLAWRLGDRWQVLMDGRTQLYSPAFWRATHLGTRRTRTDFLLPIDADAAVLPAHDSCLEQPLIDLGWKVAHHDSLAVVLLPRSRS